jgi:hypothetical protein
MKLLTTIARLAMLTGAIATAGVACSGKTLPYAGGLMIAVQTDLVAPKDVAAIGLFISSDGKPIFGDTRDVAPNGEVKFPATIAVLGDENRPKAVVKIRVVAFGRLGQVRVMRDALTTVPRRRTGLLRTPLLWVNEGSGTGSRSDLVQSASLRILDATSDGFTKLKSTCAGTDQTTIDGACVDAHIDGESLPDYHDADVFGGGSADGTGGTCFDVKACFASTAAPIALDDMIGCTTTLRDGRDPNDPKLSFAVALKEDAAGAASSTGECLGNGTCLVPLDKGTSWTVQGNAIHFTSGLCRRMRDAGALVQGIVTSFGCASKVDAIPACGPASAVGSGNATHPDGGTPPIGTGDFELPDTALSESGPNAVIALGTEILVARAGARTALPVQDPGLWGYNYTAGSGAPAIVSHWSPSPPPNAQPLYAMAIRPGGGHVLLSDSANGTLIDCQTQPVPWVCNEIPLSPGDGVAVTVSSAHAYVSIAGTNAGPGLSVYDFMVSSVRLLVNTMLPMAKVRALASSSGVTQGFVYVGYADGSVYRCDAPCETGNNTVKLVPSPITPEPVLAMAILEDAANSRNWIFWLQASGLFRLESPYTVDATKALTRTQLATPLELATRPAIAVDSRYVYWGSTGAVSFRPQDAADTEAKPGSLASDLTPIVGITTTPFRVHWATEGDVRTSGSVLSARKKAPF